MKQKIKKKISRYKIVCKIVAKLTKNKFKKYVIENWKQYYNEDINEKNLNKVCYDLQFSKLYYQIIGAEYFQFNFAKLSDLGKKEFIGNIERHEFYAKTGTLETKRILTDKYECYNFFKKYYKREMLKICNKNDYEIFSEFYKTHKKIIMKPLNSLCGRGIEILNIENISLEKAWKKISNVGECVIEELIIQNDKLGKFHEQSINSIRIATCNNGSEVNILFAGIRTGCGNSIVDNAGQGGVFASIDIETGTINSIGHTENGEKYIKHPDSNYTLMGYEIPNWKELCKIVKECAKKLNNHPVIGWDFALTNKGWVMIEANAACGFLIKQICNGGLRKDLIKYLSKEDKQKLLLHLSK